MTILQQIIAYKQQEVALKKQVIVIKQLENAKLFSKQTISLKEQLAKSSSGIIAEFKRRSPSKDNINQKASVIKVANAYEIGGATGMSVLTDTNYFGGSADDFLLARSTTNLPLLRKDFIIDEFQILEAKALGADVILLIAACLTKQQITALSEVAKQLQLEVLLEIHDETDLQKTNLTNIDIIGVNNRDLKSFKTNIQTSINLSKIIPDSFIKISESGISNPENVNLLKSYGYNGFLIGEHFMKQDNTVKAVQNFINKINPHEA